MCQGHPPLGSGTICIRPDPTMFDGVLVLVMTGHHHPVINDRYLPYTESRSRTGMVDDVCQADLEEYHLDLLTRWPYLEDFEARMSPATLEVYNSKSYGKERVVLPGPDTHECCRHRVGSHEYTCKFRDDHYKDS